MNNTTVALLNSSAVEDTKSFPIPAEAIIICVLFFPVNVSGLILLKCTSKRHGWKPFYRFVTALLLTDLFCVGTTLPIVIFQYGSSFSFKVTVPLCHFINFSHSFGILSSALIVCSMSLDRCIAITNPFVYHTLSNDKRITMILVSIWLTSAGICCMPIVGFGSSKLYFPGSWCFVDFLNSKIENRVYNLMYSVICCCILISTFIMNCMVIICLCRKSHGGIVGKSNRKKQDIHSVILLIVYSTTFSFCLTPLAVTLLVSASFGGKETLIDELVVFRQAIFNMIIDPWIYILLRTEKMAACWRRYRSRMMRSSQQKSNEINSVPLSVTRGSKGPQMSSSTTTAETSSYTTAETSSSYTTAETSSSYTTAETSSLSTTRAIIHK